MLTNSHIILISFNHNLNKETRNHFTIFITKIYLHFLFQNIRKTVNLPQHQATQKTDTRKSALDIRHIKHASEWDFFILRTSQGWPEQHKNDFQSCAFFQDVNQTENSPQNHPKKIILSIFYSQKLFFIFYNKSHVKKHSI